METATIRADQVRMNKRLRHEMNKHVEGAGSCMLAEVYEDAKGGGWYALFDCEYAALRAFYVYRGSPGVRFGFSTNLDHWYVSTCSAATARAMNGS